jgi:hypothetical protein
MTDFCMNQKSGDMKKIYLTLMTFVCGVSLFAQNGQISNGGFENWSNQNLYDYPTQWINSNVVEYRGVPTVVKSTDAASGTYSAELRSVEIGSNPDTVFGFVAHGQFGTDGPNGGIPYTQTFNTVKFKYKCSLPETGDSAYLIVFRFIGGNMTEMIAQKAVGGIQNTWADATVSITSNPQDELFIGFTIGNPMEENYCAPDSWVRIDNVQLLNNSTPTTALPDSGFEMWSVVSTEIPNDWYTTNEMFAGIGLETATKTTDANSGTYALQLTTLQLPQGNEDTLRGFVSIGAIDFDNWMNPFSGVPYNASPTAFSGSYKYNGSNGDEAVISLSLFTMGSEIFNVNKLINMNTSGYIDFTETLSYVGTPDEMRLVLYSGNNPGSLLKVDNLSLSGGNVGLDEFAKMNITLYPNPVKDQLFINSNQIHSFTITDLAGNLILTGTQNSGVYSVNTDQLSKGMYLFHLRTDYTTESIRFVKE